jgi:hypothetical protein
MDYEDTLGRIRCAGGPADGTITNSTANNGQIIQVDARSQSWPYRITATKVNATGGKARVAEYAGPTI